MSVLLLVIGDGPQRQELEREAVTQGVAARVRFLGHRNDARDWLPACDVYVNSSISEGISLTILEAMAARIPVVATRVGGTPEVVDAASGTLVPSRNPQALAEAIGRLGRDAELRRAMGIAARRRVEERFTLERMIADYRRVYERLA
jgi:glycosyltransferase involved in cell wall biosynthesis